MPEGLVAATRLRHDALHAGLRARFVRRRPLSLNRNEKAAVVADVSAQAAKSQTLALAEYRGLTVEHLNKLRRDAREKGVYLHVLKNTLARRAVAGTPFEVASAGMVGPLIYGFSEDAVAAAKVITDFAKGNDKLVIKGGAYAGKALDANGVKALAAIPSRDVLISQIAGLLKSPIQRFAAVLGALGEQKAAAVAEAVAAETAETAAAEAAAAEAAPAEVAAAVVAEAVAEAPAAPDAPAAAAAAT
jgi:large subunit ribosomal protein L10